jgi:predicted Rossmann-fold nucleotide-binding protein
MPGGFGTMDELYETLTLMQTDKISDFPMVLMGKEFWQPMLDFLVNAMVKAGTIDDLDLKRFIVTDDPIAAVEYVRAAAMQNFGLTYATKLRRRWYLFER